MGFYRAVVPLGRRGSGAVSVDPGMAGQGRVVPSERVFFHAGQGSSVRAGVSLGRAGWFR